MEDNVSLFPVFTRMSAIPGQGMKRVELDSGFQREKAHKFYENLGFEKSAYLFSYKLFRE